MIKVHINKISITTSSCKLTIVAVCCLCTLAFDCIESGQDCIAGLSKISTETIKNLYNDLKKNVGKQDYKVFIPYLICVYACSIVSRWPSVNDRQSISFIESQLCLYLKEQE